MNRDQKIKIAMIICAMIVLCAVIITSTGIFGSAGIGTYANADKYTAGGTEITDRVRNLDVNWTSGKVILAYHAEETVTLEESAKRSLSEDEQMHWWLDGNTLHVQYAKAGIRWNMPEKTLTITLPEGIELDNATIQTTSGDIEVPALKANEIDLGSTSGDIDAAVEADMVRVGATSGDLKVRLNGAADTVSIGTTSGKINLETEKADTIKAGSTSGSITITADESREIKAGSTSGAISVTARKVEKLHASATSGAVTANLSEEPGFTAKIGMTSGSFSSDIALTKNGDTYVCGDGSAEIELGTTSGNIRIAAAEAK